MVNLIIFGTGKCSDRVEDVLYQDKVHIEAYLDNSLKKQGTERNGIKILSPSSIKDLRYDYIIISTIHYQEVSGQLLKYQVPGEKIIAYYDRSHAGNGSLEEFIDTSKWDRAVIQDMVDAKLDNFKKRIMFYLDNLEYEVADKLKKEKYFFPDFYPVEETIDRIITDRCSLCRFGDGEFELMENRPRPKFQETDSALASRLKEVIASRQDNILIGIANNYGSLEDYTEQAANGIRGYMTKQVRESHYKYLEKGKIYHNAYLTRPYILYKDKGLAKKRFENIRRLWSDRDITIIEGEFTRMGVGNDLFSNAKSISRILAPDKNAFSVYGKIKEAAMQSEKERLLLLSLGPAATVLAYDLALDGYQALDIGHIDNEYEWYLAGTEERTAIPYKYVNEVSGGDKVEELNDAEYESQIVERII